MDLFSAFAVAAIGAAWMFSAQTDREIARLKGQLSRPQVLAKQLQNLLQRDQADPSKRIPGVGIRSCGDQDVCVDFTVQFQTNLDLISDADRQRLADIGRGIRRILEAEKLRDPAGDRDIEIKPHAQLVVEGHTDDTQPSEVATEPRTHFRFNWNLSAERASSLLFELDQAGLSARHGFNVVAWGRADSDPVCQPSSSKTCRDRNRRTTIRIRFDSERFRRDPDPASVLPANEKQPTR